MGAQGGDVAPIAIGTWGQSLFAKALNPRVVAEQGPGIVLDGSSDERQGSLGVLAYSAAGGGDVGGSM